MYYSGKMLPWTLFAINTEYLQIPHFEIDNNQWFLIKSMVIIYLETFDSQNRNFVIFVY